MKTTDLISAKEIRQDLIGFLRRVKSGRPLTVIYRSKPFVTINIESTKDPLSMVQAPDAGSAAAMKRALAKAAIISKNAPVVFDPKRPIDELYNELLEEKYGK